MSIAANTMIDSAVPEDLVTAGDFNAASNLIVEHSVSTAVLAASFYRLGNRFFSAEQKIAAEQAWVESQRISSSMAEAPLLQNPISQLQSRRWQTIGAVVLVILSLYVFIFTLFPRQPEPFQISNFQQSSSGNLSLWEQWWDTGRPHQRTFRQRFGTDQVWPLLRETFKKLFSNQNQELPAGIKDKLKRWLELTQNPNFGEGPTDYYALTARGLFEAREFEDALETLQDGLHYTDSPQQQERLYQDLGTVYYYKGYQLQPNGLARYDLKAVRNSVEAYEKALNFGEDPYLYGNLGWGYYLLGDFNSAIESSLQALFLKPELNYARMNLGITYLKINDYDLAFSAYSSLREYPPELEEYAGGIRDLLELQLESPGRYPFTNFVLGQLYWQQGRHKKARSAWEKFIKQKFSATVWQERARLFLNKMEE